MHESIINFILQNPNDLCIPIGILIRYVGPMLRMIGVKKQNQKSEDLLSKTYAHIVTLQERTEDDMNRKTKILVKNDALRRENKALKGEKSVLASINMAMQEKITSLEKRLKDEN